MAEIIASDLVIAVLQKLASEAVEKIVHSQGIQSKLKNLERTFSQIQKLLNDASQKEVTDEAVKGWLNSLQHLAYDIDDILDDLATEAMDRELNIEESVGITSKVKKLIPTCCTNFSLSTRMSHKLDHITKEVQDLEKEKYTLGLVVKDDRPKNINRKLQTSVVDESKIVGRQVEKEALIHKLLRNESCAENFSLVPIVGIGGAGKTTLARLLYNENQVKDHFELKAWVCVSNEFDSFGISKVIFQSVGGENKEFADFNLLQVALKNQLTGKRFILVLDDVWSESYEDWETLVAPFHACAPGSKIIVTTRKDQLLKKLGYNHIDQLQSLSHDEALSLVALHALGVRNFDLHPTLKPHGEDIVEKCGRLPLALIALGRLLRTKHNEEDYWKEVLNSEIWSLQDGGEIAPALRLSYQDLSACLKRLFAYCSLFPKDFIFDKRELVLLWMAEGFLQHLTLKKSTQEHFGHECFDKLLSRSFFQPAPNDESLFVMHDLMNDLATSIAGEFFVRLEDDLEKDNGSEALEKYRHMSFVREEYGTYNKFKAFKRATSLRTFLATSVGVITWQNFYLSNKILVDLLPELPLLRVLNLSNFEITEVPESIGSLRHLRYLNLSETEIRQLPENVCNLYNLQTLILFGCRSLADLPNNFSKLKNLHHFDIGDTPSLNKIPLGISKLKSLQTLSKVIIGGENRFEITELEELENLCGEISIEGLDKVHHAVDARKANFSQKRLSELEVKWSHVFDGFRKEMLEKDVLDELKPHNDTLKQLKIVSYGGKDLPNWIGDKSFVKLAHLSIRGCKKITSLPSLGQLPSLGELDIEGMDALNTVGLELLGTDVSFPSLRILRFKNMEGWKVWSTNCGVVFPCLEELDILSCPNLVEVSLEALPSLKILRFENMEGWKVWSTNCGVVFPCLEKLDIIRCPNLVEVSLEALPSLISFEIRECGQSVLRSLVQVASSVTELKIESISGLTDEVWRGVGEHLRAVEELSMRKCDEIRYLWESEGKASMVLVSLRKLTVWNCDNLVSLGEREDDVDDKCGSNLLTSLRILHISNCKSMDRCMCPNNIETLSIYKCDSITDISFSSGGGGGGQKLKSLWIGECEKLMKKELGGYEGGDKSRMLINNNKGTPLLQNLTIYHLKNLKFILQLNCFSHLTSLDIWNCESLESLPDVQLPNLTSLHIINCKILESLPDVQLPNLTSLKIFDCKSLESFGDVQLPNLTSLKILEIFNCPRMDSTFPRGLWPPKLVTLRIGQLKKPISEWGPQNFPPSLVGLTLAGESSENEDASISSSQLSRLLPSSLTTLSFWGFKELETISMGLEHLTSLQHLTIFKCPKMKDLPEMLLPSLLSLEITDCPKLKERCGGSESSRGSSYYWPLISHIPRIDI